MFVSTSGSMNSPSRRTARVFPAILLVLVMGMCVAGSAQTPPTITSISPSSVAAGGPSFTLTVTGSNYLANGSNQ